MTRPHSSFVAIAAALLLASCSGSSKQTFPGSPSSPSSSPTINLFRGISTGFSGNERVSATSVAFPPQNEPVDFLTKLEAKYRDQLHRSPLPTFVDPVGHGVWMADYLRYRLNACTHADAVSKVLTEVDTQGTVIPPECGTAGTGRIPFPPQNEPVDFLNQLEAKYRDQLRRGAISTYVDGVGQGVWMSDYLRYRVNNCGHDDAVSKVMTEVDTAGTTIPPDCTVVPPGKPPVTDPPPSVQINVTGSCLVNAPNNTLSGCTIQGVANFSVTTYKWTFTVKTDYTPPNNPYVTEVGCNFPASGGFYNETINLTASGPSGSMTASPKSVQITKGPNAC